jgi:hypothetical protein
MYAHVYMHACICVHINIYKHIHMHVLSLSDALTFSHEFNHFMKDS